MLKNFAIETGALYLADRGYYNAEGIEHVLRDGGHVLIRMPMNNPALMNKAKKRHQNLPLREQNIFVYLQLFLQKSFLQLTPWISTINDGR